MKTGAQKLICLVAPGHLTATPRLLKEADALAAAEYRVHVVSLDNFSPNRLLDDEIVTKSNWTATRIPSVRGVGGLARRVLHRGAQRLPPGWLARLAFLATRAQQAEAGRLIHAARAVPAHYFSGHCLGALVPVATAARHRGVRFGFDLEDFHEAETLEGERNPKALAVARSLLSRHLPSASHLTAASPLIAEAYRRHYAVDAKVVLNVFPLDHAPAGPVDPGPISPDRPAILYWVSQTIGPGRGLEEVIAALALVRTPVELHLRGHVTADYSAQLTTFAQQVGCAHRIRLLPFSASAEVVRLAARADLGLSTERTTPYNRAICLTNKVFIYPLAGVPQLMSDTPAQTSLASELGAAALPFSLNDCPGTAATIDNFLSSPEKITVARKQAWTLGQTRYNWDYESGKFLGEIATVLAH